MFYQNIDPVLLRIGPMEIRYYGLMYAIGFLAGYFILRHLSSKRKIDLSDDDLMDFLIYMMIGLIVGARILYIIFYSPAYYVAHPSDALMIWKGGLSFHGGLIGVIAAGMIFCRRKRIRFMQMADIAVVPFAFGLILGRIGNYMNGELYGRPTELWWGVGFSGEDVFRHPSQVYEAFKNFVIFITLWSIDYEKVPEGFYLGCFMVMYSAMRFLIEFVREPEIMMWGLTMGQILSIPLFLAGISVLAYAYRRWHKRRD